MTDVSKTDYLKRYLGKEDSEKKRKRKRKFAGSKVSRLKILDKDIDIKSIQFGDKAEEEDYDEAPVVAEIIDERPVEEKVKELYESSRWKKLHVDSERSQSSNNVSSKTEEIVGENGDHDISSPRQSSACFGRHKNAKEHYLSSNDRTSSVSASYQKCRKIVHDSDSDVSPPRTNQQNNRHGTRHDSDSDNSPPRARGQTSHHHSRHDSDSDNSPPRSNHQDMHNHRKQDSGSDISPPRIRQSVYSSKSRYDSDSNDSVRNKGKNISSSHSTGKRKVKHEANDAKSMDPKLKNWHDSDSDLSPDRRTDKDIPSLGNRKHSAPRGNSDSDFSPPRLKVSSDGIKLSKDVKGKPVKTLSGLKAGLQNAETLKRETQELREREKKHITKLDAELSGRNADTVIRDRKTGLKRNLEEERRVKYEQAKKVEEQQQKYAEWGKGIEQTESRKNKFSEDLYEMSKPLARYCDDDDLEERLKSIIHDEDPMSAYMRKKKKKETPDVPTYNGPPAPPNRFGIPPGYRWDGVDRSSGFEKKYFEKHNSRKAVQEEAYLWSVQNM